MNAKALHRTAPQREHKAAQELREAGHKAYVPRQRLRRPNPFTGKYWPVAPGYVATTSQAMQAFPIYCKTKIGHVRADELARLYQPRRNRQHNAGHKFAEGDRVKIKVGQFADMTATVVKVTTKGYQVGVPMFGKTCTVFVPQRYLYKVTHPG